MNWDFDYNEWFVVITAVVCLILFLSIKKRLPSSVIVIIWLSAALYIEVLDYFLAARPFDLYDFLDGPEYQPSLAIIHFFIIPPLCVLLLHFYDKWKLRGIRLFLYLLCWTGVSVLYEWLCLKNGVLHYNDWNLLYSIPTYPVTCLIFIWIFHQVMRLYHDYVYAH